jgi:hypothetical protein
MNIDLLVDQVDIGTIYRHILELEGERHPISSPTRLSKAANYILSKLKSYGLRIKYHDFKVEGFDTTFRNVEGAIGRGNGEELLIVSHYDTVQDSPGANDNASGVAAMLESARILSKEKNASNIRFISFSLEEQNSSYVLKANETAQNLGLMDKSNRYTNFHTHRIMEHVRRFQAKALTAGKSPAKALKEAYSQFEDQMSESEKKYVRELEKPYKKITSMSWPGKTSLIGSSLWVENAIRTQAKVLGVLCLETIGYTSNLEFSQRIPDGMTPEMFQTHRVSDISTGNFLAIIGDANSDGLAKLLCTKCRLDSIGLPYACLLVPLRFDDIAQFGLIDLLRSDHAPFWRAGIPGLMLTDTANFRYPYYHTQADTIEKLDFAFLEKICKAVVATAADFSTAKRCKDR